MPSSNPAQTDDAGQAADRPPRPWKLLGLSLAFSAVIAAGGYAWTGSPQLIGAVPPPAHADAQTGHGPGGMDAQQFIGLVEQLRQRLEAEPNNAEGWAMLGRSYMVLERAGDAVPAFEKAVALAPNDAALLSDYAVAVGVRNGSKLEGEPARIVERALKADPKHPRALSLAGSVAFERGDHAAAIGHWERALSTAAPDSEFAEQLKASMAQAREAQQASGGKASAAATQTAPAAQAAPAAAAPAATDRSFVAGQASLSPEVRAAVSPDHTVFVFARPAEGSRMPLAILRKQVKDLPLAFHLDDSMAMTPQARLSGAERVVVGVRVSKSGNATPQPGDFEGLSDPVSPGTRDVNVVVRNAARP